MIKKFDCINSFLKDYLVSEQNSIGLSSDCFKWFLDKETYSNITINGSSLCKNSKAFQDSDLLIYTDKFSNKTQYCFLLNEMKLGEKYVYKNNELSILENSYVNNDKKEIIV